MSKRASRVPRSFAVFSSLLFAAALVFLAFSWRVHPFLFTPQLILAVAGAALAEFFSFGVAGVSVSLAYPLVTCVIALCGPAAAGVAAALTAVPFEDIRRRRPISVMAFNVGQLVISSCIGGWVYMMVGARVLQGPSGVVAPLTPADFPHALYGIIGAALVYGVINVALVSIGSGMYRGVEPWAVAKELLPVLLPSHVALPFVGFVMAQVLSIQIFALPLFVFPLLVARQLYRRYLELRLAYADTIRSLIGALEAKDPYTRGHSERVSVYAASLGTAMGLESKALERLEYAALLHDLGKLSVPQAVLTKPGRLAPDEMDQIRKHPARGAEMVRRIPPLRDLAEMVSQHHERIDGKGYPDGIPGGSMALEARILAVADCYDAMTTTRAYRAALSREQALSELAEGCDTQFDAQVVRCFIESDVGSDAGVPIEEGPRPSRIRLAEAPEE